LTLLSMLLTFAMYNRRETVECGLLLSTNRMLTCASYDIRSNDTSGAVTYLGVNLANQLQFFDIASDRTTIWRPQCDGSVSAVYQGKSLSFTDGGYFVSVDQVSPAKRALAIPNSPCAKALGLTSSKISIGSISHGIASGIAAATAGITAGIIDDIVSANAINTGLERCPNGDTAIQKADFGFYSNGCGGATGIASCVPNLIFEDCCNGHDHCYSRRHPL
jgi:hypothetical protein